MPPPQPWARSPPRASPWRSRRCSPTTRRSPTSPTRPALIDIATAKQALAKSKNPKVREFAEEMVRDHGAVNDKALALVKKLGVTPQDNPTSQSLAEIEGEKRADQAKLSGHAFDVAYAANEVAYHKMVDNALEQTLIPDAQNAELKSLLQTGLKLFQMHEQHAEQLVADLK